MSTAAERQGIAAIETPDRKRGPKGILSAIRSVLRKNPSLEWLIPTLLCAVLLGQLLLSGRQLSQTTDEAYHLYAGYRDLKCGDFDFGREHPPLARIVAAAPLLSMKLEMNCGPVNGVASFSWRNAVANADNIDRFVVALNWLYTQDWRTALFRARMAVSAFALGLCLLVWIAARRMFGLTIAIVATLLLIFEPNVLAFGSLVMTDVPVTCMLLFAVFAFYLWTGNRTAPFLLLAGLATGLTLLVKHSGVLVIPILFLLATIDAFIQTKTDDKPPPSSTAFRNLLAVGIICVIAAGILWIGYGMRFAAGHAKALEPQTPAASTNTGILLAIMERSHVENSRFLPQPYLQGFAEALAVTNQAVPGFALGRLYPSSPWFFVPLTLAIRLSAAFLVMIPLAAIGIVMFFKRYRREFLFLLIPASVHLAVCLQAGRVGGVRHILPMFPFLLIAVAAGCVELARRVRWVNYAVPCLIVLHAASSLHAYPNYLSYANEFWGGPKKSYKYLGGTDLGQAYPQVRDYLERHRADPCWLLTDWFWNPGLYGVHCQPVGYYFGRRIPSRLQGTVIVSSTLLTTVKEEQGQAVAPFLNEKPQDQIGGSALLVYEGDFDTRAAAGMTAWQRALVGGEPLDAALQDANEAIGLEPKSPYAHEVRCGLLAKSGQLQEAIAECETAIALAEGDSLHQRELQSEIEDAKQVIRAIKAASNLPNP